MKKNNVREWTDSRQRVFDDCIVDTMKSSFSLLRRVHSSTRFRFLSSYVVQELQADQYGLPADVLKLNQTETIDSNKLKANEVLIKLLASPINPADINMIEGKYALLPASLPATFGNEGVFQVLEHRASDEQVRPGDWVIPKLLEWGKWRSHGVVSINDLIKIPSDIGVESAATLSVNPCTAYRLLKDFVALEKGDTVIQNGGNSGVGQAVIQLAKVWNINVVNIVRNREQGMAELLEYLKSLGAEHVYVEEDLRKGSFGEEKAWRREVQSCFTCRRPSQYSLVNDSTTETRSELCRRKSDERSTSCPRQRRYDGHLWWHE